MNPLRLIRTSTFQLAWWYMGIFGSSALILVGYIYWQTNGYLEQQTNATISAEIRGLTEQFRQSGGPGVEAVIRDRVVRDPARSTLYLLLTADQRPVLGNLAGWPPGQLDADGWYRFTLVNQENRRVPFQGQILQVNDDYRLLVAKEQSNLEATRQLINRVYILTLAIGLLLALLGGIVLSSSVTRRVDAINRTSREIMAGRLQRRMPVRGINDEFDQLADNLNAMLDRIDSLIDSVRAVTDNIAHDLRTPLTRLRGRLESLALQPEISETVRNELNATITDADHLLATFRALLRIARIESGTHDEAWTDIDMGALLHDAWELYHAVGEEKEITVHLGAASGHMRGDRDLIFQAVSNLLDNAIKYSPAGSDVRLEMRDDGGLLTIIVSDQGPGVPEAERGKVLDRFYRTATVTGIPGSGLGLSLVNAIARHHGGQLILADNAPGLRVLLELPKTDLTGPAAVPEASLSRAARPAASPTGASHG
ncbi:MAG: HAMP domain-containing histidine kinase [Chromatiales bacterium]|nr:HAMP domain-containing histidine kinase [Chromatiales bacterium]